ncbi:hypothetical protein AX774_g7336, partial [Zancudomyces culisetae]
MEIRYNRDVKIYKFKIGDYVLKRVEIEKSKLESYWEGPYQVERVLAKGAYIINDNHGSRDLVNGDLLKMYNASNNMIPE